MVEPEVQWCGEKKSESPGPQVWWAQDKQGWYLAGRNESPGRNIAFV